MSKVNLMPGKDSLLLNVGLVLFYTLIALNFDFPISEEVVFAGADAKEYLSTGSEFFNLSETGHSFTRPFLYPLILKMATAVMGLKGIWFLQFIFWMISGNLIWMSVLKVTNKRWIAYVASTVFALNIGLISLTFHALTELTTAMLLSLVLFHTVCNNDKRSSIAFFEKLLLLLVLLTVVKPLFSIPLWIYLLVVLPVFYLREYRKQPFRILVLPVIAAPLILQMGVMKHKYGEFTVSKISERTVREYIFTQGYQQILKTENRDSLITVVNSMPEEERKSIFKANSGIFVKNFFANISGNLTGGSTFLSYPTEYQHPKMSRFMEHFNSALRYVHYLMLPLVLLLGFRFLKDKRWDLLFLILPTYFLLFYQIFTSGISFYQGDRLVISAFPLVCGIYPIMIFLQVKSKSHVTLS